MHNWCFFLALLYKVVEFLVLHSQPAEMSLEEVEEKLGSLIQADTISQLKSTVWKERLEGTFYFFLQKLKNIVSPLKSILEVRSYSRKQCLIFEVWRTKANDTCICNSYW